MLIDSLNPIVALLFLATNHLYSSYHLLIAMGNCLPCISTYSNIDMTLLRRMRSQEQKHTNYFRYTEGRRFHNEKIAHIHSQTT
jgi:hypothetical protein